MAQIMIGTVNVTIPEGLTIPERAGDLSKEEKSRIPRARRGVGLVCDHTAAALIKKGDALQVPEVEPAEMVKAGAAAELIDQVIVDLEAVLEKLKQANLLIDAEAHTALRKVHAHVSAVSKFHPEMAELFTPLATYFGKK